MGERQKPKKNGREEKANSKKNHRIGDFDSSCSGTVFCLFLSQEHRYEKNDLVPTTNYNQPFTIT